MNGGGGLLDLGDSVESGDLGSRPFSPSVNGVNPDKLCDSLASVSSLRIKGLGRGALPLLQAPQAKLSLSPFLLFLWSCASSFSRFLPQVPMCAFPLPSS